MITPMSVSEHRFLETFPKVSRRSFLTISGILVAGALTSGTNEIFAQSPEAYKKIEAVEDMIRPLTIENGYYFDDSGSEILHVTGGPNAVSTPQEYWSEVRNAIYTHNHPAFVLEADGTIDRTLLPLSAQDFEEAAILQLKEIRAVAINPDNGKRTLSWAKRGNRIYWPDFPIEGINHEISDMYYKLGGKWYDGEKFDWEIIIKAANQVYSRLAKKEGFEYGYEELDRETPVSFSLPSQEKSASLPLAGKIIEAPNYA